MQQIPLTATPGFPLAAITVGRGCAAQVQISYVPTNVTAITFWIIALDGTKHQVSATPSNGKATLWIEPYHAATIGVLTYTVTGKVGDRDIWFGDGSITVRQSPLDSGGGGGGGQPALDSDGLYVPCGEGLYRRLTATIDDTGLPTVDVSETLYKFEDGTYQEVIDNE